MICGESNVQLIFFGKILFKHHLFQCHTSTLIKRRLSKIGLKNKKVKKQFAGWMGSLRSLKKLDGHMFTFYSDKLYSLCFQKNRYIVKII